MWNRLVCCVLLFSLGGCGYRYVGAADREKAVSISVPYVQGDADGELTNALVRALSSSGGFVVQREGGHWILQASIIGHPNERIGYKYDRNGVSGKLKKNLIGVENRKGVIVEFLVVDSRTDELIVPLTRISAAVEYDYVVTDSVRDLSFIDAAGVRQKTISFSLGQLDSIEGAQDDANTPIYRRLAQEIVDGLTLQGLK